MRMDLHVHTNRSEDSINSPDWIMDMARIRGLHGLAVTDHNTIKAWKPMQEAARKKGLHLILGEEIRVFQSGRKSGEILGLFLNEAKARNPRRGDRQDKAAGRDCGCCPSI